MHMHIEPPKSPGPLSYYPIEPNISELLLPIGMIRPVSRSAGSPGSGSAKPGSPSAKPGSPFSVPSAQASGVDTSPSLPGRRSASPLTKVATYGRDFLNSIYYDQYTKSSPGRIYDSNSASRHVSTTIPTATAIFAPNKKGTRACQD